MDVGSKRSVAFSKYFKQYGWTPHVLSVRNPDRAYCRLGDERPPNGISVEYTYSIANLYRPLGKINGLIAKMASAFGVEAKRNYFYDILCIPDHFWGWLPHTLVSAWCRMKQFDIDVIYVSCSPFSSGLIGIALKNLTGKPAVLDFRDPFALDLMTDSELPRFRVKANQALERYMLDRADALILTTEETREAYSDMYPQFKGKMHTIHNGFEHHTPLPDAPEKYDKFTIVYAGQFYLHMQQLTVYTDIFFQALAHLKMEGTISRDSFQFLYHGDAEREIAEIAGGHDVVDLVWAGASIPHEQIIEIVRKSHVQLLRIVKPMISTKLYEGIALNIPFLATIPPGEARDTVRAYSPSSRVITEESSERVAEAIKGLMREYERNEIQDNHIERFLDVFSRERLTLKLMDIVDQTVLSKAKM